MGKTRHSKSEHIVGKSAVFRGIEASNTDGNDYCSDVEFVIEGRDGFG